NTSDGGAVAKSLDTSVEAADTSVRATGHQLSFLAQVVSLFRDRPLDPAEFFDRLLDRAELLDERDHLVFGVVELLSLLENFGGFGAGDYYDAVFISDDDVEIGRAS